jgi:23S rRNA (adenine2503-C2)-methyltransferase
MEYGRGKSLELLGKSREELKAYCAALNEPAYRADQIYHWLYAEREFSVERWSNLPAVLREKLKRETTITLPTVRQRYVSSDGSVRYLFGLPAQEAKSLNIPAAVEAVFMPSEGRQTICISTQAGCAVDCQFCLTAQLGLIRNLTAGEMVAQVLMPLKEMEEKETGGQIGGADKRPASLPLSGQAEGGPYTHKKQPEPV